MHWLWLWNGRCILDAWDFLSTQGLAAHLHTQQIFVMLPTDIGFPGHCCTATAPRPISIAMHVVRELQSMHKQNKDAGTLPLILSTTLCPKALRSPELDTVSAMHSGPLWWDTPLVRLGLKSCRLLADGRMVRMIYGHSEMKKGCTFPACHLLFFSRLFFLYFQEDKSNLALLLTVLSVSSVSRMLKL